ncbi:hypothetical protein Q0M30_17005, partial [Staphylococcus aureus]|nr:hypothetical protein [Staphylococcus aureus]
TYNYEEINLDNIRDIHTINDEYVNVDTETQTENTVSESQTIDDDMSEGKDENVSYDGANTLGDTPTDEVINSQSNGDLNKDTTEIQS